MLYRKYIRDRIEHIYKIKKVKGNPLIFKSKAKKKAISYTLNGKTNYGKNLLSYPYYESRRISYGVTFTTPKPGVVIANGKNIHSSQSAYFQLSNFTNLPKGKYILSGCPRGGGTKNYYLSAQATKDNATIPNVAASDTGSGAILDLTGIDYDTVRIHVLIGPGVSANNLKFRPTLALIESAYDPNPANLITFPYYNASNNKPLSGSIQELDDIIYTINEDGSINTHKTALSISQLFFQMWRFDIPIFENMHYKLTGCPEGGSADTYRFEMMFANGNEFVADYQDYGNGVIINKFPDEWDRVVFKIWINKDITMPNLLFKPKLVPIYGGENKVIGTELTKTTINGITITDTKDGKLTINGTNPELKFDFPICTLNKDKFDLNSTYCMNIVGLDTNKFVPKFYFYNGNDVVKTQELSTVPYINFSKLNIEFDKITFVLTITESASFDNLIIQPILKQIDEEYKNLITYPFAETTQTRDGITFTDNKDGTITANGTATANVWYPQTTRSKATIYANKGTYTLLGCPAGGGNNTYYQQAYYYNGTATIKIFTENGDSNTQSMDGLDVTSISTNINIVSGTTVENLVFKPTLLKTSGDIGNLIPFPYTGKTNTTNGVTYTDNHDRSVTVSGTPTDYSNFVFCQQLSVSPNITYALQTKASEDVSNLQITIRQLDSSNNLIDSELTIANFDVPYIFTSASNVKYLTIYVKRKGNNVECKGTILPYLINLNDISYNVLSYPYLEYTKDINGITFTDKRNGSVIANGTTGDNTAALGCFNQYLPRGQYYIAGSPSNGSNTTYHTWSYAAKSGNTEGSGLVDTGTGGILNVKYTNHDKIRNFLVIEKNTTVKDLEFKPEIRLLDGDANLIPYPYYETTKTLNGVTFTDNGDGSIMVNGTTTAEKGAGFTIAYNTNGIIGNGIYYLSGCPSGGSLTSYMIQSNVDGVWQSSNYDIGAGKLINVQSSIIQIAIIIKPNVTIENLVFKPQLISLDTKISNVLPYPYSESTKETNGITFTDNQDGTLTLNGTATGPATIYLYQNTKSLPNNVKNGDYLQLAFETSKTLSVSSTSGGNLVMNGFNPDGISMEGINVGSLNTFKSTVTFSKPIIIPDAWKGISLYLNIRTGTILDNIIVKPMLIKLNKNNSITRPYSADTLVQNGVKKIDNGDGSITFSGTSSNYATFNLYNNRNALPPSINIKDKIIASLVSDKPFTTTHYINYLCNYYDSVDQTFKAGSQSAFSSVYPTISQGRAVDVTDRWQGIQAYVVTMQKATYNNITVKPMLMNVTKNNLATWPYAFLQANTNGLTITAKENNTINVNGTATNDTYTIVKEFLVEKGKTYFVGSNIAKAIPTNDTAYQLYLTNQDDNNAKVLKNNIFNINYDSKNCFVAQITGYIVLKLAVYKDYAMDNVNIEPYLLEIDYEDYEKLGVGDKTHNILPYPYKSISHTESGITFTDNNDGSITVNGTATANASFTCIENAGDIYDKGYYYVSGCPSGGSSLTYNMQNKVDGSWEGKYYDIGNGQILNVQNSIENIIVYVRLGVTVDNIIFKPQLIKLDENCENLLPYPYYQTTLESNGITFTDNRDGSITVNGTATGNTRITLSFSNQSSKVSKILPKGKFAFIPNCSNPTTGCAFYWQAMNNSGSAIIQIYKNTPFIVDTTDIDYTLDNVFIYVANGTTVDNVTFKPVITPVDYELYGYKVPITNKCKNLANFGNFNEAANVGITAKYLKNEDCLLINGTATATGAITLEYLNKKIKPGTYYSLLTKYLSGMVDRTNGTTETKYAGIYFNKSNVPGTSINWLDCDFQEYDQKKVNKINDCNYITKVHLYVEDGITFTNYKVKVQLEEGPEATIYEPYRDTEITNIYLNQPLGDDETATYKRDGSLQVYKHTNTIFTDTKVTNDIELKYLG